MRGLTLQPYGLRSGAASFRYSFATTPQAALTRAAASRALCTARRGEPSTFLRPATTFFPTVTASPSPLDLHQRRPYAKHSRNAKADAKKASKHSKSHDADSTPPSSSASSSDPLDDASKHPAADPADPLNLADVTSRLAQLATHHRDEIKRLRASGGRFSPANLGSLPVQPDKHAAATFPLRELAEIVPRQGKTISLLVHEKDYLKPIISAVQASPDFNQQPQRHPDNELELLLKVEAERPEELAARVKAVANRWREKARGVRAKREKQVAAWLKDKKIVPDVKFEVEKALGKVQDQVMKEIDEVEKQKR